MTKLLNDSRRVGCSHGVWAVLFTIALGVQPEQAGALEASVLAGVGIADITPEFSVRLNGFGFRRTPTSEVRQRIHAKALAFGPSDKAPCVIVVCDTLGVPASLAQRVRAKLQQRFGVPAEQVAILATHTHTAPMVNDVSPTLFGTPIPPEHQQQIDRYSALFEARILEAAVKALESRVPAAITWGQGKVSFASNRRTSGGPVDHDMPLLAIRSPDGALRAVFVNYACHCVSLSDNRISGDWAGYAQEMIERANPGCTAFVAIGCGADSNPNTGVVGDRAEVAVAHAMEIADEVQRLLRGPLTALPATVQARRKTIPLPLAELPTREVWEERARQDSATGHHARTQLATLRQGRSLPDRVKYEIQSWSFGDKLAILFLPGEVVVDYALRLKSELDGQRLWINAYANGCPGYIPSERILKEGGYEGGGAMIYYGLPGPYAAGVEDRIVHEVRTQLGESFKSPHDAATTAGTRPHAASRSIAMMRLADPQLQVELMVGEPLVCSPVAIDFGTRGELWVAEMYDYPSGIDGKYTPGGRIKRVTDSDGDGRYDQATLFLDGIPFPTGVTAWRNGVLVCAAPDILYAEDTDGDGTADVVRTLYTGFATHNYQARVNSLEYGLDGWVYGACGLFGGTIHSLKRDTTLELGRRDFRIAPDHGVIEPVSGNTQQGRVRDDWGNWFGCNNSMLLQSYPLNDQYLARNPKLLPPPAIVPLAAGPLFPISQTVRFKLSGPSGGVTSACGLGIYRDIALGGDYSGNAFVCEPVNNLVHRREIHYDSLECSSARVTTELQREFLASQDPWFRPVQAKSGPAGGLWIVDMYRYVIEHPRWIPEDTKAQLDLRAGANLGRIYRVTRRDKSTPLPDAVHRLNTEQLVGAMESTNGERRDLIQQQLLWKDDRDAREPLAELARHSPRPEVRIQAMWTLQGLDGLDALLLQELIADPSPQVRCHVVQLSEPFLARDEDLLDKVLRLARDCEPWEARQLCYSLREVNDSRAADVLAQLAFRFRDQRYLLAAFAGSLHSRNIGPVFQALAEESGRPTQTLAADAPWDELWRVVVEQVLAWADPPTTRECVKTLIHRLRQDVSASRANAMVRLLRAFRTDSRRAEEILIGPLAEPLQQLAGELRGQLDATEREWLQAELNAHDPNRRTVSGSDLFPSLLMLVAEINAVTRSGHHQIERFLAPRYPLQWQLAAVEALSETLPDRFAEVTLACWPQQGPQVRAAVLRQLITRREWTQRLLLGLEDQSIAVADLDAKLHEQLRDHANPELRERAKRLLDSSTSNSQADVLSRFRPALQLPGRPRHGRRLFQQHCASCHRLDDLGYVLGPDLSPYATKSKEALWVAVLDPNQAIDPRYHGYTVQLEDGRVLNGVMLEEGATAITLGQADGKRTTVLRSTIERLQHSGKSFMPEGLERELTPQGLADLMSWVRQTRTTAKQLEGNHPAVVVADATGPVLLPASRAFIHGDQITFERPFGNIGYWHADSDFVRWRLHTSRPRQFDVWVDYACATEAAGNAFQLLVGDAEFKATVKSTGGWGHYERQKLGSVMLPLGQHEVSLRPAGELRRALFDLRSVSLVPVDAPPTNKSP